MYFKDGQLGHFNYTSHSSINIVQGFPATRGNLSDIK